MPPPAPELAPDPAADRQPETGTAADPALADPALADPALAELAPLLDRLEELLAEVEGLDEGVQATVFELLDGVDAVHRLAVHRLTDRLVDQLGADAPGRLAGGDAAVGWLLQAYGVGVDDVEAAERALDPVRPYLTEHGGDVEVLAVSRGVVRVRLTGACSGCTSAAVTLRHGVEECLREHLPGFAAMDVAPDSGAAPHPPPGPTLLQIQPRPA